MLCGQPHHVTQRGNNRQDVFFVDGDRRVYLELLQAHCERYGFALLGYCLMGNHTRPMLIHPVLQDTQATLSTGPPTRRPPYDGILCRLACGCLLPPGGRMRSSAAFLVDIPTRGLSR